MKEKPTVEEEVLGEKSSFLSRLVFFIFGAAFLLVIAAALSLLYLRSEDGHRYLENKIKFALKDSIKGRLDFQIVEGSLLGSVVVRDVSLWTNDNDFVAATPQIKASYNIFSLLDGKLVIDSIESENLVLAIENKSGKSTLSGLFVGSEEESKSEGLEIELSSIELKDSFLVSYSSTKEGSPFEYTKPISPEQLRTLLNDAQGPGKSSSSIGPVILGDMETTLSVHISSRGQTRVKVLGYRSTLGIDKVLQQQELSIGPLSALFVEKTMEIKGGTLSIGKKARLTRLKFTGSFPTDEDQKNWFKTHTLKVENLVLSRGYVRALSEFQINPKEDIIVNLSTKGALPSHFQYDIESAFASTTISSKGELRNALSEGDLQIDSSFTISAFELADILPLDTLATGKGRIEVKGSIGPSPDLRINGALGELNIEGYLFEKADFSVHLHEGKLDLKVLDLTWGNLLAELGGEFTNEGPFSLTMKGHTKTSSETVSLLTNQHAKGRGEVNLSASGRLNWDASEPVYFLEQIDADGAWDIDRLDAAPLMLRDSRGKLKVILTPKEGKKDLVLKLDTVGKEVRFRKDFARKYKVNADLKTRLSAPYEIEDILSQLKGNFDINLAKGKVVGADVSGLAVNAKIDSRGPSHFSYNVKGKVKKLTLKDRKITGVKVRAKGTFQTRKKPSQIKNISALGDLSVETYDDGKNTIRDLESTFSLRKKSVGVKGKVHFKGKKVKGGAYIFSDLEGDIDLKEGSIFEATIVGIQEKKEGEGKPIEVHAKGSFKDEFRLDTLDMGGDGYAILQGSKGGPSAVKVGKDEVVFSDLRVEKGDQKLNINGEVRQGKSQDVNLSLEKINIADIGKEFGLAFLAPYKGVLSGQIAVGGSASAPIGNFSLHLENFYSGKIGPFDVRLVGNYRDENLNLGTIEILFLNEVTLSGDASLPISIQQDGSIKWFFDRPIRSRQEIRSFDCGTILHQLYDSGGLVIDGRISASLDLSGSLNQPKVDTQWRFEKLGAHGFLGQNEAGKIDMNLGPFDGSFDIATPKEKGGKFRSSLKVESELGKLAFSLSSREDFPKMVRDFLIDASLPDYRDFDFEAGIRTQDFNLKKLLVGPLVEGKMEGKVDLSADFHGTLKKPHFGGKISVNDLGWKRFRDFEIYTAFSLDPTLFQISGLRLGWDGSQILEANSEIPNPFALLAQGAKIDESPLKIDVSFVPFKLSKLSAFDYKFASLSGVLKGGISARGSLKKMELDADFGLCDVVFGDGKKGSSKIVVQLEKERLKMVGDIFRPSKTGKSNDVALLLSLPFTQNFSSAFKDKKWIKAGNISGHFRSQDTPLSGLLPRSLYTSYIGDLEGSLLSDLVISGTSASPNLSGAFAVKGAGFTIRKYGRRFENVGLKIAFDKNNIEVEEFLAEDGTGSLAGKGVAKLEDWKIKSLYADLKVDRFSIEGFSSIPAFISAKASFRGDLSRANVEVATLKVVLPENQRAGALATALDEDIIVITNSTEEIEELDEKGTIVDMIYSKMNVVIDKGEIVHPLANVYFKGDLKVHLANIGALIYGDLITTGGRVETFGKVFTIQPGLVTFRGLDPPNPFLELEAHYKLSKHITDVVGEASSGEARAIVRVSGPAFDSKQQFSSDPEMSEPDVIFVLITDQAPGSAGVGQAEAGLALGAASTGLTGIASLIVGGANKVLPDIAKLDVVRVEAGENEGKVEVGKYLSRKLFVLYRYRFGAEEGESQHEVNFEYRFLPSWILDFQVGDADQGEMNLLWDIY